MHLYILELTGDRYYVGVTEDLPRRIAEHFSTEGGSEWTRLHPPQRVVSVSELKTPLEEDSTTESYMSLYGIDKVRGGSYANINLTTSQREVLNKKMAAANGACFRCGQNGHFAKNCSGK